MATQPKTAEVRYRIDVDLKARATAVLDACGLSVSDAMRLFLHKVVEVEGLPFENRSAVRTPIPPASVGGITNADLNQKLKARQ